MAKLVYASDSKSDVREGVRVRVPPSAPNHIQEGNDMKDATNLILKSNTGKKMLLREYNDRISLKRESIIKMLLRAFFPKTG